MVILLVDNVDRILVTVYTETKNTEYWSLYHVIMCSRDEFIKIELKSRERDR